MVRGLKLLLDTHALIWFAIGDTRLPQAAREAIEDPLNVVFVSAASAWEIAAKHRKGKLPQASVLVASWATILTTLDLIDLPITSAHAIRSGSIRLANADPFDRMIVAQAHLDGLVVVSNETEWDATGLVRLWT